jgi:iron(III) transport system ATP-binding protein
MGISIKNLRKTFNTKSGSPVSAVDDISLELDDGEFLVILGPSGSGKTTLLRCIAGLEQADEGEISISGREVYSSGRKVWVPPEKRGLSMVFQSYALWPHMTVFDNVAYPLRVQHNDKRQLAEKVDRVLTLVGCGQLTKRYPGQLSGGQQQRVAVARAIVAGTDAVLFDEPLSSIDARVREDLRKELVSLQAELGFTAVYITHDQTEATVMGHRVAVLADGKLQQLAPPRELYDRPNSAFVAQFIGAANQFAGSLETVGDGTGRIQSVLGEILVRKLDDGLRAGDGVLAIVRPESFGLSREHPIDDRLNAWPCTVERSLFLGLCTEYLVRVAGIQISVKSMDAELADGMTEGWLTVAPEHVHVVKS